MSHPPYTITHKSLELVAKISEKVGEHHGITEHSLRLHRINRLRSVQSSLAIEDNSLSIEQVRDIINGRRVLGPPKEIQEVKSAYKAYECLSEYDPYSVESILRAHEYMTEGLLEKDESGCFRSTGVGIYDGDVLIHAGTPDAGSLITSL